MKYKYVSITLFLLCLSIGLFGQTIDALKKPRYERVSEAYGYIIGQEYSLNLIKRDFPQFEMAISRAQIAFNSSFGRTKEQMVNFLTEYFGQKNYDDYNEKLTTEFQKLLKGQSFTEEAADNFITEVQNRAKGNISSPVLETLLSFQFYNRPQDEFISGFTTTFHTKGHPKAKTTDWQIKVPMSWRAKEAERPNIIKIFTSDFGDGNQSVMLMVKEIPLPTGYKVTKTEINELFTENRARGMVPKGGRLISFTKMTLDDNTGAMLEYEQTTSRLDLNIKMRNIQFMFFRANKMYMLLCTVGSEKTNEDLSLETKKYLPLFRLIANSIVVLDQYK